MPIVINAPMGRIHMGKARYVNNIDGDTPTIQLNIRLLSVDTPESHYPGSNTPGKYNQELQSLLQNGGSKWDAGLKAFLAPKLANDAGALQEKWGEKAKVQFAALALKNLEVINPKTGRKRRKGVFLTAGDEVFDGYQRLLAYVAPEEPKGEKRKTFNLLLVEEGIAVNYVIYPNLPKLEDWECVQKAAQHARLKGKGFWKDKEILLGYEYRFCVDTAIGKREGPDKYCVDVTTGRLYQPQEYYLVSPEDRLFIMKRDLKAAKKNLNLKE